MVRFGFDITEEENIVVCIIKIKLIKSTLKFYYIYKLI